MSDESVPDPNVSEIVFDPDGLDALTGTAAEPTRSDERRLADLIAGNQRAEGKLQAQGVQLGNEAVTALQVRALLRLVVGDDPVRRMAFDITYQECVSEGLAEIAADLAKRAKASRLLVPGAPTLPNLRVNGH